jgi:hypothetical protein
MGVCDEMYVRFTGIACNCRTAVCEGEVLLIWGRVKGKWEKREEKYGRLCAWLNVE